MKPVTDWRPRDAWVFAGWAFLYNCLSAIFEIVLAIDFPKLGHFLGKQAISSTIFVFNLCVFCAISIFQAKIKSFSEFKAAFDLSKPREADLLVSMGIGVLLQFGGIMLFGGHLSNIHTPHSLDIKKIPSLFSPFLEEPPMRAFVYNSFRNSYSIGISVLFTTVIALFFHTQILRSLYQFVGISVLNVTLCLIKERKLSLWNCIACHFVFNAIFVGMA